MTRINVGVLPQELCDQHLLAEHREIVRVRLAQNSKSYPPKQFKLGSGHVLFFKDKLGYIHDRYIQLYNECIKRGFNITDMRDSFDGFDLKGQYKPSEHDRNTIIDRIQERLLNMKRVTYTNAPYKHYKNIKKEI